MDDFVTAMPPPRKTRRRNQPRRRKPAPKKVWLVLRHDGLEILQAGPLAGLGWLVHGFSTRRGGHSHLNGHPALSLSLTEWDTRIAVLANRREFQVALGAAGMALVTLRQMHSDVAHSVDQPPAGRLRGDALLTRTPGLLLGVQTADCLPILLADTRHRAVAAVHAGWRGTLKRAVEKTLGRMQMLFGTRPADVVAALGPGIGRCCYEVGPEVVQQFAGQFAEAREWFAAPAGARGRAASFDQIAAGDTPNPLKWLSMAPPGHDPPPPRLRLNLAAANCWQLQHAGVRAKNLVTSDLCTACRTDLLFSHRAERGHTGRLLGVIAIKN